MWDFERGLEVERMRVLRLVREEVVEIRLWKVEEVEEEEGRSGLLGF